MSGIKTIALDSKVKETLVKKYGKDKLRIVELPMNDMGTEVLEVAVLVPSRSVMSQYMRFIDSNPKKAQEILINHCLLTSKEEVNADDALFNTCVMGIAELFPIREYKIKNF